MSREQSDSSPAIRVQGLSKLYRRAAPGARLRTLKSAIVERSLTSHLSREEAIVAIDRVDFEVARGEAFGIVGGNGSGKSTLLKIVAGMLRPTSGVVEVNGRVAALIELGAGFHPEISGRENVYINGAVLGLTKREIDARYDQIVEFSGLGDFMEEPVKYYSSGMYVRLGFAVAIHTDPEVLLVDEVLAVGDEEFAHRCLKRIEAHLSRGGTVLFVSHSLDLVADLCDRALWLEHGVQRGIGSPRRVIDSYRLDVAEREGQSHRAEADRRNDQSGSEALGGEPMRWGSGAAEIESIRLLGEDGAERYHLVTGETATIEITVHAGAPLDDFVFGVELKTPRGETVWGTNTDLAGGEPLKLRGRATVRLVCPSFRLAAGEYRADVAIHARDGAPYDYRREALGFTVTSAARGIGVYAPEHAWEFDGEVDWRVAPRKLPKKPGPFEAV